MVLDEYSMSAYCHWSLATLLGAMLKAAGPDRLQKKPGPEKSQDKLGIPKEFRSGLEPVRRGGRRSGKLGR